MNCNDICPLICGYLDGVNTESENEMLQRHVADCAQCREILMQMQENDRLLAEVPGAPVGLTRRIMEQVRREPKKSSGWKPWVAVMSAAAVLTMILLSGVSFPHMSRTAETADAAMENETLYEIVEEACIEGRTATACATMDMQSTEAGKMQESDSLAVYLITAPVAELEKMEPMDPGEARTLLTADAAARLDATASGELQAYLLPHDRMLALLEKYPFDLLSDNTETETCLVFIFVQDANTP